MCNRTAGRPVRHARRHHGFTLPEALLAIVVVGVGDGPWDAMDDFDDNLPARHFDNFQFVNATKVWEDNPHNPDVAFAIAALMEIPEGYLAIRKLGYLG